MKYYKHKDIIYQSGDRKGQERSLNDLYRVYYNTPAYDLPLLTEITKEEYQLIN